MVRARKQTITSLFCSLQQVLVALWNSADENDFLEMIKEWIYCQDKTLDPYRQILKHIYYREHPKEPDIPKAIMDGLENNGKKCMFIGV